MAQRHRDTEAKLRDAIGLAEVMTCEVRMVHGLATGKLLTTRQPSAALR